MLPGHATLVVRVRQVCSLSYCLHFKRPRSGLSILTFLSTLARKIHTLTDHTSHNRPFCTRQAHTSASNIHYYSYMFCKNDRTWKISTATLFSLSRKCKICKLKIMFYYYNFPPAWIWFFSEICMQSLLFMREGLKIKFFMS